MSDETPRKEPLLSEDLLLWRLESLEAGQRSLDAGQKTMQLSVNEIQSSLKSYRAVWKFATMAAAGCATLLTLLFKWFGS